MNAKKILPLIALLLFGQCSMLQSDDNDDTALALLLGISASCVLGGQSFIPSGGVTCSGGTASGTGTLTATSQTEDVSLHIVPSISGSGSIGIFALAGSDPTSGVMSEITWNGTKYKINNKTNLESLDQEFTSSLCYEVHGDHEHVFLKKDGTCFGSEDAETDFVDSFTETGESWGFVLNNATISGLTVNGEPQLSH